MENFFDLLDAGQDAPAQDNDYCAGDILPEQPEPIKNGHSLALPLTIADLIKEHDEKESRIEDAIGNFKQAFTDLNMASTVQGTYVENIASEPYLYASYLRKNLLKSGWLAVYNRLAIGDIASAKDKKLFDQAMADPPPLTMDNIKATFGDYLLNPRFHILRGLAEVFTSLDPAYKSHSKVRIGVNGLPKRIIIKGWGEFFSNYARDQFTNLCNALATYQGIKHFSYEEMNAIEDAHDHGEDAILDGRSWERAARRSWEKPSTYKTVDRGLTVRKFANGNIHVFFSKWTAFDINKALAEFYGEVLPDVDEQNPTKAPSTAVAKDLQYYWTPPEVVAKALEFAAVHGKESYSGTPPVLNVLEPSCGDGRILDGIAQRGSKALGIEYDRRRAEQAKAKGHSVICANFLEHPAQPTFDRVVMNPPFYGRHYIKHVEHALKFLKPGGILVAILPATARYDHKELEGDWVDLPTASFAAAGTNVPTTMLRISRPRG